LEKYFGFKLLNLFLQLSNYKHSGCILTEKTLMGREWGSVVSELAFYSDGPNLNPGGSCLKNDPELC